MEVRIKKVVSTIQRMYPHPTPSLSFKNPFECLVATILSAQCTDVRVNIVTQELFPVANTPEKILALGEKGLIRYIRSTGFYRAKARHILGTCKKLIEDFGSTVPATLEELQTLPGAGRKTASVVLSQAFHIPAFPVDRHVLRVANRLALAHATTPDKTDLQLRKTIPKKWWIPFHIQLIYLGRQLCKPKPLCEKCPLLPLWPEGKKRAVKRTR